MTGLQACFSALSALNSGTAGFPYQQPPLVTYNVSSFGQDSTACGVLEPLSPRYGGQCVNCGLGIVVREMQGHMRTFHASKRTIKKLSMVLLLDSYHGQGITRVHEPSDTFELFLDDGGNR